jgi:hypothetical protein
MIELHGKHLKKIQGNYTNILERALRENTRLSLDDELELHQKISELASTILKDENISNHLTEVDIISHIYRDLYKSVFSTSNIKNFSSQKKKPDANTLVQQLIEFLQGLPYYYDVYFQTSLTLPPSVTHLPISESMSIIKIDDPESFGFLAEKTHSSVLASLLMEKNEVPAMAQGEVYVKCQIKGYISPNSTEGTIGQVYKTLKQFIYLGNAISLCSYQPYSTSPFKEAKAFTIQTDKNDSHPIPFTLPPSIKATLAKIQMSESILNAPSKAATNKKTQEQSNKAFTFLDIDNNQEVSPTFSHKAESVSRFLQLDRQKKIQIERAIDWGFEGLVNHSKDNGFIQTCIGLEAILSDAKLTRNSEARLADRCAYLLANKRSEREEIFQDFIEIYQLRSQLVHGQIDTIPRNKNYLTLQAQSILQRAILIEATNS